MLKLVVPDRLCVSCLPKGTFRLVWCIDSVTCSIQDGKVFYSIDGNFGLCRKKASGSSVRTPLHQRAKFLDQGSIDEYVKYYGKIQMFASKVCPDIKWVVHTYGSICLCLFIVIRSFWRETHLDLILTSWNWSHWDRMLVQVSIQAFFYASWRAVKHMITYVLFVV